MTTWIVFYKINENYASLPVLMEVKSHASCVHSCSTLLKSKSVSAAAL